MLNKAEHSYFRKGLSLSTRFFRKDILFGNIGNLNLSPSGKINRWKTIAHTPGDNSTPLHGKNSSLLSHFGERGSVGALASIPRRRLALEFPKLIYVGITSLERETRQGSGREYDSIFPPDFRIRTKKGATFPAQGSKGHTINLCPDQESERRLFSPLRISTGTIFPAQST